MSSPPPVISSHHSDRGPVRDLNEDSYGTPDSMGVPSELRRRKGWLYAVADGMGGRAAGEVASRQAIHTLFAAYYGHASDDPGEGLKAAFEQANAEIYAMAQADVNRHGMGTTLVAAVVRNGHLFVASVGDSRAYIVPQQGTIRQITDDHTIAAEQFRQGLINAQEAREHQYRSVLTRAMGVEPEVQVDLFELRLNPWRPHPLVLRWHHE